MSNPSDSLDEELRKMMSGWWNGESFDVELDDIKALIEAHSLKERIEELQAAKGLEHPSVSNTFAGVMAYLDHRISELKKEE